MCLIDSGQTEGQNVAESTAFTLVCYKYYADNPTEKKTHVVWPLGQNGRDS